MPSPAVAGRVPGARHDLRGLAAVTSAFAIWGFLPLYLRPLAPVPALELIAHRIAWCCLFALLWLYVRGESGAVGRALADPGVRARLLLSTALISVNWLTYVWAVAHGHVIESSLGYFINPLLNVLLGVLLLRERLNRTQWAAVALAAIGVAYLTIEAGRLPWIALVLAGSFALYGFTRKVVRVEAVPGLAAETLMIAPLAVAYLVWREVAAVGTFGRTGWPIDLLLVGSGVVTALPLALFAYGARRIPYSVVGIIQYLGPTLQLLLGIFVFGEPFPPGRAFGFALIGCGLALYLTDGLWRARQSRGLARASPETPE